MLTRHDAPPSGVEAATTSYYGGAGGAGCGDVVDAPSVRVDSSAGRSVDGAVFGFGELFSFCIEGFAAGLDVALVITGPDSSVDRRSLCRCGKDAGWETFWGSFPGDTLGTYEVRASQGDRRWAGAFRVVPQRKRLMRVVDGGPKGTVNDPGDTVRVVLAGFPASALVALNIYSEDRDGIFLTQVRTRTDREGVTLYRLRTAVGDPKGCYIVHTTPPVDFNEMPGYTDHVDRFCLS